MSEQDLYRLLRQQYKCGLYEGNDPTPSRRY